jgi:endoglucanase
LESVAREFLFRLLKTPSPSGYEQPIQQVVREYLGACADSVTTDSHGNVIGAKNPAAPMRMLLAGHCDQIGLIVQYIDSDGFISVQPIGGWDPIQLVGSRVTIWTASGAVTGVMSRKPIHLLTEEERKVVPKMKDLWIDIGAENQADCESVVRIGDAVTLELEVRLLRRNLACSVAMDDKVGLWVVLEAFRRAAAAGPLPCALFVASTVQEEIGLRGAQGKEVLNKHIDVSLGKREPVVQKKGFLASFFS